MEDDIDLSYDLHPSIMAKMLNTFSLFVSGEIFPNPTLVRMVKVKYRDDMYLDLMSGPPVGS